MHVLRTAVAVLGTTAALIVGPVSVAHAGPPANHGQCVSNSPQPSGPGGRSGVGNKSNGGCPAPAECTTNGNATFNSAKNTAVVTGTGPGTPGSSVECTTSIPLSGGQSVTFSFDYTLSDGTAPCGGGIPRMFLAVDTTGDGIADDYPNTFDDNPNTCESNTGTFTYTAPAGGGTIVGFGLVYDRGDYGSATYSNVMIGGQPVDF